MGPTLETIATYCVRVVPGLVLGAGLLFLARRQPRLRVVLYLALFVLLQDAMTPLGLWSFDPQGFFWIHLHSDPWFLVAFGVACLGLSLGLYYLDQDNRPLFRRTRGSVPVGLLWGVGGALAAVAPFVAIYQQTAVESRGGARSLPSTSPRSYCSPYWGTCWKKHSFGATCTDSSRRR
jgi:hypothetical protein